MKEIVLTIGNSQCTESFVDSIEIFLLPSVNAGMDTIICANTNIQIGENALPNYQYSWRPFETLDNPNLAMPFASPVASLTVYHLVITDNNNCEAEDEVVITMLDEAISQAGTDVELCEGDGIYIGAAFIEGQSYSWIPTDGLDDAMSSNPFAVPSVTTTYTVKARIGNCREVEDNVTVRVNALPQVDAGNDITIEKGKNAQLLATGGINYSWEPGSLLNNSRIHNPIASPLVTTEFVVNVNNILGCENSDLMVVNVVNGEFWLPNGFTPNRDGINDIFYVRGLSYSVRNFEFKIVDNWGNVVFLSNNPNKGWDGNSMDKQRPLPVGAYVYFVNAINAEDENVSINGMVNLIR